MSQNEAIRLLDKYINGECTSEERRQVEDWLESLDKGSSEWKNLTVEARKEYIENLFHDLKKQISSRPHNSRVKNRRIYKWIYKVAAAMILLAVAYGAFHLLGLRLGKANRDQLLTRSSTGIGEIREVTLEDGTQVFLNAASELQYPSRFSGKTREVYLKGEAFFKVAGRAGKPFIVHSGKLNTRVLGTSFNISAYTDDDKVQITVLTGKVSIAKSDKRSAETVMLTKNEQLTYISTKGQLIADRITNASDYSNWRNGKLAFYHSPMNEVVKALHRTYGLIIRLENSALKGCEISGHFEKKQAPEDILKAICLSIGGHYEKHGNQIVIKGPGCK